MSNVHCYTEQGDDISFHTNVAKSFTVTPLIFTVFTIPSLIFTTFSALKANYFTGYHSFVIQAYNTYPLE